MADNTAYQDLLKDTSESKENGNYFLITITDLNPNTSYPIEFRWMYSDKRVNDNWSAVKLITTPGESEPNTPKFTSSNVNVDSPEKIIITWDGTSDDAGNPEITNYDRIDVYIDGIPFDGTKAAYSFKAPGTATIAAPAGTYQIVLYAVSKTGKLSPVSSAVTKTVVSAGVPIQTPTLPSGISVATAPFAVTVNWNGTYSSNTFTGFKSIDIYAVTSDLGSSVTSGITSTNLVGSLTVNDTTNRINIGLDNLRQALGLASNSDVYNATIFYYYNATNNNNIKYGSPTYTRINSSSVIPTKANYIDLVSGVISIENLVAGNGQFSSWLRTGSPGGARIELSSVSDFINNGYTVQKGLVAYSSGNTELFNLDLDNGSLTINGSGTFTGDLSAGSGSSIFKSDSNGIYLGSSTWAGAANTFRVSRNGVLAAVSGTIGGWTLGSTYLQGNNIKLDTTGIVVGSTSSSYFDISPSALTHRNSDGTASGKFTLTLGASPQLTIDGTLTVNGNSLATTAALSGKVSNGQVANDSSFTANNIVYKINGNTNTTTIDGGKITTGTVVAGSVVAGWVYAGNISANQINAGTLSANYISGGTITGVAYNNGSGTFEVTSGGALTASSATITGTLNADSGRIGNASTGWTVDSDGTLHNGSSTYIFPSANNTSVGGGTGTSNSLSYYSNRGIMVFPGAGSGFGYTAFGTNFVTFNGTSPHISSSSNVRINDAFAPNADDAYSLGFSTARWQIVRSAGGVSTTSDLRIKKDIEDSQLGLDFINKLRPVSFKMISGAKVYKDGAVKEIVDGLIVEPELVDRPGVRTHWGFIAQEVKEAIDSSGVEDFAGWQLDDKDDPESQQSLVHHEFLSPIVKAIQELSNKLDLIEQRLDALEA